MSHTPDPKTLTEAVNLGKEWGIDTAEAILALAIAETLEANRTAMSGYELLNKLRGNFKAKCAAYKSQLTKPVTEEEKRKLTES